MKPCLIPLLALSLCALVAPSLRAEEKPAPSPAEAKAPDKKDSTDAKSVPGKASETHHTVAIGGQNVAYTADAGTLTLKTEEGKAKADVFYVAYTKDGVSDLSARPVTFCFNGGPGAASVWLHLGALGPVKVKLNEDRTAGPPPYRVESNPNSILDVTDLVFIDPVSTGYSRPAPGESAEQFHGVSEDREWMGEFIRDYTTRHRRWPSPKFLIGESYGTTRAALLASWLQSRYHMYLNGIMLVSTVLNFQNISFGNGNDLPYLLYLPSYTASAWYHKKLPADLQKSLPDALKEAEAFALGEYAHAMLEGADLRGEERAKVIHHLSRLTGLTPEFLDESDLRVPMGRFGKTLLRGERKQVGRYDSRYTSDVTDPVGTDTEADPSFDAVAGAFSAAINDYLRTDLKYESDVPYEILKGMGWNWGGGPQYTNSSDDLRDAIVQNPYLKVFVAAGYYDLATPYYSVEYTFSHLGLPEDLRKNVTMGFYPSGHMVYLHGPSLAQLKKDLAQFVRSATAPAR